MKILKKLFSKSFFSGFQGRALSLCFKLATPRRQFGRSKIFPSGEIFAPSLSALFERGIAIEFSFFCGCIQVVSRPHRGFADILIILCRQIGTHPLAPPHRKPGGGSKRVRTSLFSVLNIVFGAFGTRYAFGTIYLRYDMPSARYVRLRRTCIN